MLEGCLGGEEAVLGPSSRWNPACDGMPRAEALAGLESYLVSAVGSGIHWLRSSFMEPTVLRQAGLPAEQAELGWAQHSVAGNEAKHQFTSANKTWSHEPAPASLLCLLP